MSLLISGLLFLAGGVCTTLLIRRKLYRPVFSLVGRVGGRMRELHQPRVSRSLLYIVLTMVILIGLLFLPALRP